jgi:hypothetical protein
LEPAILFEAEAKFAHGSESRTAATFTAMDVFVLVLGLLTAFASGAFFIYSARIATETPEFGRLIVYASAGIVVTALCALYVLGHAL